MEMWTGLTVDGQYVRTRVTKRTEIIVWIGYHQMDIEWKLGDTTNGFDNRRANGDVWHKVAVHHVDVNPICPTCLDRRDLVRKTSEISSENRWSDL